jgi:hypothetical protein
VILGRVCSNPSSALPFSDKGDKVHVLNMAVSAVGIIYHTAASTG